MRKNKLDNLFQKLNIGEYSFITFIGTLITFTSVFIITSKIKNPTYLKHTSAANNECKYIGKWGFYGTNEGNFDQPWGTGLTSNGDFVVAESSGNRIQKFDRKGVFILRWGSSGSGDGQFNTPRGLEVDSKHKNVVYVADMSNNRVQKFNEDGVFITKWGEYGSKNGQFHNPGGVAVDLIGNVYVSDVSNNRIQKFSADGKFVGKFEGTSETGQLLAPWGIAVDELGYVYIADTGNHRVLVFDSSGKFIRKWGSFGTGDGQFHYPIYLTILKNPFSDDQNILVVDQDNARVQRFTLSGQFISKWGKTGIGDGELYLPADISSSSDGYIYIADAYNYRVQIFSCGNNIYPPIPIPYCKTELTWGEPGTKEGQFNQPTYIDLDSTNNIYVSDSWNNRVQKFDSQGKFLLTWGTMGSGDGQFSHPQGIAVDRLRNYIYIVDGGNSRIQKFDLDGKFLFNWGSAGVGDGQFRDPQGVAVDRDGNVYVVDQQNQRIQKFSQDGNFILKWGSSGTQNGYFKWPRGIEIDDTKEEIYIVDTGNQRVQIFDLDGNYKRKWDRKYLRGRDITGTYDITLDKEGNNYIPNVPEEGRSWIQKYDSIGNFVTQWGSFGTGELQFKFPIGVVTTPSLLQDQLYLYVSETQGNRISKLSCRVTYP